MPQLIPNVLSHSSIDRDILYLSLVDGSIPHFCGTHFPLNLGISPSLHSVTNKSLSP